MSTFRHLKFLSIALLSLIAISGCSRLAPTAPSASVPLGGNAEPVPLHVDRPDQVGARPTANPLGVRPIAWYKVAESWVYAGEEKTVGGGRYELRFFPQSLSAPAQVTIHEFDSKVLAVQFGPHGTKFGKPVELTIDFSGTNADPEADAYDGSRPALYYFNDVTRGWEEVPGTTNWSQLEHVVQLQHFSLYVLGGKAGW